MMPPFSFYGKIPLICAGSEILRAEVVIFIQTARVEFNFSLQNLKYGDAKWIRVQT
jgi:hypothetical protein